MRVSNRTTGPAAGWMPDAMCTEDSEKDVGTSMPHRWQEHGYSQDHTEGSRNHSELLSQQEMSGQSMDQGLVPNFSE